MEPDFLETDLSLARKSVTLKSGNERFTENARDLNFALLDFWRWSASDTLSNTTRGVLAEFIVAKALGIENTVRVEWNACDLICRNGMKVEVKASSYLQSWRQSRLSKVVFSISKARTWNPDTNALSTDACRIADVYVFALLKHKDKKSVDLLNLDQWNFYVVPTCTLDGYARSQSSITLASLENLASAKSFSQLRDAVDIAYTTNKSSRYSTG